MRIDDLEPSERLRGFSHGLCWRVGPFAVRVTTSLRELANQLGFLYREFPLLQPDVLADGEIGVHACGFGGRRASIFSDGRVVYPRIPRGQVVPLVEWTLNLTVFHRPCWHLLIHAAVVEKEGKALILPGEAGSGKSTLCAALIHRGWRLLSDEVAVIRQSDAKLHPVPRPVSLKEESIEVVRRYAPEAEFGPIWRETPKGRLAHVLPPRDSVRRMDELAVPTWIVFPTFNRGVETAIVPLSKGHAALECGGHSFNYSTLGRQGFRLLTAMVDACDCYRLSFGDLESAVTSIHQLTSPAAHLELASRGPAS